MKTIQMPRLRGKYDHPAFQRVFSRTFIMDRNFFEPLEDLARKKPAFRDKWRQIIRERQLGHVSKVEAEKRIWEEVQKAVKSKK